MLKCGFLFVSVAVWAAAWARAPDYIEPRTGMQFVRIPAGSFRMGSPRSEPWRQDDEIPHRVTIERPFLMGIHEVTQAEWLRVLGDNPSVHQGCSACPVENVNWSDVERFLAALNGDARPPQFRLPTEAEWEYACRAGSETSYATGEALLPRDANVDGGSTRIAGSYPANRWGLFDMHGNVWEWCDSWYGPYPQPAKSGTKRVIRGGSWLFGADSARCALRYTHEPKDRGPSLGFRLVRTD